MARYSQARIAQLLNQCDNAPTADARGDYLEELARYLFEKVPGVVFYRRNVLDAARSHELDAVFKNRIHASELYFLDTVLFIECKSSGNPVGSAEVGWFVRKLQDRGAHAGVVIAL